MARGKYAFRPDKEKFDLLGKLYLPPKQRMRLLKWGLYILLLLVLSVLQDVILSRFHLYGATTDLMPCAILLICLLEGAQSGCVFTLAAACFYSFSGTAPGSYCIAFLTLLGLAVTIFRQTYLRKTFLTTVVCLGFALCCYEMLVYGVGLFYGNTTLLRWKIYLLSAGYSLVAVPVLYPIIRGIEKIGGETWTE